MNIIMAEGGGNGVPDIKQQKQQISEFLETPLKKGDCWYLIDSKWFKQWKKFVGYDSWDVYNMGNDACNPGPVDNSGLFVEGDVGNLKEHLIDELDFVLVPTEAWEKLTTWYGAIKDQPPVHRKVVEYGMFVKHCKVEVYLMELKLCENSNLDNMVPQKFSKADTIETIEKEMKRLFNIEDEKETRIWNKYMSNTYEQLSKKENTVQDAGLYQGQVLVIEQKNQDGTWPRQPASNNSTTNSSYKDSSSSTSTNSSRYITNSSGRSSYSYPSYNSSSSSDYGRSMKPSVQEGLCGLGNLGNTCFMNSALQCMSNVPPLTRYFLSNEHKKELNYDNPLGMHGEIAKAYADLIQQMWSGLNSYLIPRNFKMQVGRFAPQFSGYQQHDSQELLAFLCDGLHEDLNRIQKKPYVELRDSDGRPDEVVADEAWANHLKRNDSIIVDLFHGQFKSTLVCPECQKISVTFDPFSFLSLPLPTKKERTMEVFLIRLDPKSKPLQMKVVVPKHGMVYDLCKAISKVSQISPDKMAVTDVYNHRFHKVFAPNDRVESITERDDIFVYEVPVNSADDPDTIIIPVYLRERNAKRGSFSYSSSSYSLFGQPMLIAVPRKHTTYQDLYQIIMNKMSRYVRKPDTDDWYKEDEEGNEVVENGETEMDSDSDSKDHCSSGDETSQNHKEDPPPSKEKKPKSKPLDRRSLLFRMTLVNSYGSAELARLKDDGAPLRFNNRTYIALDWKDKAKDKFYIETEAEDSEPHESMNLRSVSRKQQVDLSECLNLFLTEETLEKEDSWYCPACKKHQQATKKFDLWKLPKVLIIHLKRFSYNRFLRDKLDTLVTFPTENLDMSGSVMCLNGGPYEYDLVAVSNHYGGMGGGHYTAYAQNACTQNWNYFDDSSVSDANKEQVVSKAAYVLFYLRKDRVEEYNQSLSQVIASRGEETTQNGEAEEEEQHIATETCDRKLRSHTGARSKRHSNGLSDSEEEMETN